MQRTTHSHKPATLTFIQTLMLGVLFCLLSISKLAAEENVYGLSITNLNETSIKVLEVHAQFPTAAIGAEWWHSAAWGVSTAGPLEDETTEGTQYILPFPDRTQPRYCLVGEDLLLQDAGGDECAYFEGRSFRTRRSESRFTDANVPAYKQKDDIGDNYWIYMATMYNEPIKWRVKYQCLNQDEKTLTTGQLSAGAYEADDFGNKWQIAITGCSGSFVVTDEDDLALWTAALEQKGLKGEWTPWLNQDHNESKLSEDETIETHQALGNIPCEAPKGIVCYNVDKDMYLYEADEERDEAQDYADIECNLTRGMQCRSGWLDKDEENCDWDWKVKYFCEYSDMPNQTGWLDQDNPGSAGNGDHDWEKLNQHIGAGNVQNEFIDVEPAYVAMRRISDEKDVVSTGDDVTLSTIYGGKVKNDSSNPASGDYEIQFYYGWTPWLDRDNPSGTGDYEHHSEYTSWSSAPYGGRMPQRDPTAVECRAKNYQGVVFSDQSPTDSNGYVLGDLGDGHDRYFTCNTETGFICHNDYNTDRGKEDCMDVDAEARYYFGNEKICDGNVLDGVDNGYCDGTDGEAQIVAAWNTNLCLNIIGNQTSTWGESANVYDCNQVTERWRFNLTTGKIHAVWNSDLCLNVVGNNTASAGTDVNIWYCPDVTETWQYDESTGKIHAGWNSNLCLNAVGNNSATNGSNVNVYTCSAVTETWTIQYDY